MTEDNEQMDEEAQSNNRTGGFPFTRRGMLAAGAAGLGLAGVGAAGAQEGENGSNDAPFADEDHDHSGDYLGEQEPVDRIDLRQLGGSRREGDTVYYDPDNPGPYVDGQDAIEDVPTGGKLQLGYGVWNVATEGRIALDRPIHIQGSGWYQDPENRHSHGTKILNKNTDKPAVEFSDSTRQQHATLRDLLVQHAGQSPAVRFNNFIRTLVADCWINASSQAPTGIKYDNDSFFARVLRSRVGAFTDYGIHVTGRGYAHEFYSNHVASGRDNATAIETQRQRTIIVGGEYAITGNNGTAIRFYNPEESGPQRVQEGGVVIEPGIEHTEVGIDINTDGPGRFDNVQIYHTVLALRGMDTGVKFGNTMGSKLIYPVLPTKGKIAEWSADAHRSGIITDMHNFLNCAYDRHDDAAQPFVHVTGAASNNQLSKFPTGVRTTVDHGIERNSPVFHNGSSWHDMPTNSFSVESDDGGSEPDTVHYEAANKTITPDGELETSGLSTWNVAEDGTLTELSDGDTAGTIGGDIWLSWDADNLYFQAAIDDQLHHQPYEPGELWRGDSIQVAVAPGSDGWDEFQQYTLARNDAGTQVHGVITSATDTRGAGVRNFDAQIVRDDTAKQTRYEIAIPLTELDALGGFDPASDEYLGVDWAVLDADGVSEDNIDRYVPWYATGASAITAGKDPAMLKATQLLD